MLAAASIIRPTPTKAAVGFRHFIRFRPLAFRRRLRPCTSQAAATITSSIRHRAFIATSFGRFTPDVALAAFRWRERPHHPPAAACGLFSRCEDFDIGRCRDMAHHSVGSVGMIASLCDHASQTGEILIIAWAASVGVSRLYEQSICISRS